ncbi:hypothetical protein [Streptomyces sasae]|uniref:hypothetical protein n=1 Tax=Streptomyces sasae TaxID=1266772 RepID=UPI00293037DE|nr:hypothetical protein [Streptomyces sasae]
MVGAELLGIKREDIDVEVNERELRKLPSPAPATFQDVLISRDHAEPTPSLSRT